ncbi:hypothetical protein AHF37_10566 [Paragonimus kellicotti]|nr:hypothetical protein AHF37_10566 [Paragonimus kellicotti]
MPAFLPHTGGSVSASTFSRHIHSTNAMRHATSVVPPANNMKDSAILCMTDEQVLELSTEEYNGVITTIRNMMQHFVFENEFFERCIMKMKMDPDLEPTLPNSGFSVCFTIRLRRPSGFFGTDRTVCLTGSQKCELARGELEEFTKDLAMMKNDCDAIISDFKVTLEDLDLTLIRIKRHHERLKKDVSPYLKDPSKKMEAHNAFLRFHQIVMDDLEAAAEKLKTANANCIVLHRDMLRHIKEYEVSGNQIHVVDIHELRVRSQEALQEIQRLYLQSCWYKALTARATLTLERTRVGLVCVAVGTSAF